MHELSIALSILEIAEEEAESQGEGGRVVAIHLKLGPLSGVVKSALTSAYDLAREGTSLAGAELIVEEIALTAYCPTCDTTCGRRRRRDIMELLCPGCTAPSDPRGRHRPRAGSRRPGDDRVMSESPRLVEVRQHVLKHNDVAARALRARFQAAGTYVVSLVSSPGSGKTAFLEKVLGALNSTDRVAALVGDLATDNDAQRLARSGAPVKQIVTGTVCHLEAEMVAQALEAARWGELDYLFIENVGNLVCPSSFDLGEDLRLVLFSVTEGEDKPLKYPTIFNTSDVALITKIDLAAAVEFDAEAARRSIESVRPGMEVHEVSSKTGAGMGRHGWNRSKPAAARRTARRP